MTSISSGSETREETQLISASEWWLMLCSEAMERGEPPSGEDSARARGCGGGLL